MEEQLIQNQLLDLFAGHYGSLLPDSPPCSEPGSGPRRGLIYKHRSGRVTFPFLLRSYLELT